MQCSLITVVKAKDDTQIPHLTAKLLLQALEEALCFFLKISSVFLHLNERSRERESKTVVTQILRPVSEET